MSPEVEAAIVEVAGNWAIAIQERYSAPGKSEELILRLEETFEKCYDSLHGIVKEE